MITYKDCPECVRRLARHRLPNGSLDPPGELQIGELCGCARVVTQDRLHPCRQHHPPVLVAHAHLPLAGMPLMRA